MQPEDTAAPFAEGSAGERASEAFGVLGNETRLTILLALWEAYEPFEEQDGLEFSEIRDRVGAIDSGQFNYHLDRLVGHFVESTEDGYALTRSGLQFVRSVIAGAGIEEPTLEPTAVDTTCTLCGSQVQVAYEDGWVTIRCSECDGMWGVTDDEPGGWSVSDKQRAVGARWRALGGANGAWPTTGRPRTSERATPGSSERRRMSERGAERPVSRSEPCERRGAFHPLQLRCYQSRLQPSNTHTNSKH